jgi:hypothetical protein
MLERKRQGHERRVGVTISASSLSVATEQTDGRRLIAAVRSADFRIPRKPFINASRVRARFGRISLTCISAI